MFYKIFLSPQVKQWAIITYKHGAYELSHDSPHDLKLTTLQHMKKAPQPHRMIAHPQVPLPKQKLWQY